MILECPGGPTIPLVLLLVLPSLARAQGSPLLEVGPETHVTADDPTGVYVEPTIAVDPSDASRMAIAAIHLRDPHSDRWQDRQTIAVFSSRDGGRSWSRRALQMLPAAWFAGDPWLAWGHGSNLYLVAIAGESLTEAGALQYTALFRSADGGWTWPEVPRRPFAVGSFQDHPVLSFSDAGLAVAGTIADGTGEGVYVARCESCAQPLTDGESWKSAVRVERVEPGGRQLNLGGAALLQDGSIVIGYYTMVTPRRYWVQRLPPVTGGPKLLRENILPVGFPPLAAEPGGQRVATAWVEAIDGGWSLRALTSPDGGRRWGLPMEVGLVGADGLPMMPAIAVSRDGLVAITWQEQASGTGCARLFAALADPTGRQFGPAVPVSSVPSCPASPANGVAAHRFRFGGGDYMGLAPVGPTEFQAVWADARVGTFQIYTTRLRRGE